MRTLLSKILGLILTLVVGGLLGGTLVLLSPGSDVDEREMDLRRSEESIQALREQNANQRSVGRFYISYLGGILRGDLGNSRSFNRPVTEILMERLGPTAREVALGCAFAWILGLLAAVVAASSRSLIWDMVTTATSGVLLSLPVAVMGLFVFWAGIGPEWAMGAAVFPKIFRYSVGLFRNAYAQPYLITATAKGLSKSRILLAHVIRPSLNELLAIAGVSVGLAFGAAIPIEAVCDVPGLGQLAWQSAMARDLPVLVGLTLVITLVVKSASMVADVSRAALGEAAQ